jgi:hypothetical protein
MSTAFRRFRGSRLSSAIVAVVLVLGLGWVGLAGIARQEAQPSAAPSTTAAIHELGRRFHVPASKQFQLQVMFALAGGDDMRQALRDTAVALQRSNAADDLTAPPAPTGDALFDRYALAIDAALNSANTGKTKFNKTAAAISDAELAQWESGFGQDPRFWELRYLCAKGLGSNAQLATGFNLPSDFLDEAQRRGIATANTLLVRYTELREAHAAELKPFAPPANKPAPPAPSQGLAPAPAQTGAAQSAATPASPNPQVAVITKRQRQEQLALLNAAVSAGPGEAWPRYMRALYWFELGEQAKGLDDLEAGNAAPMANSPAPWPLNYVLASPGQPVPAGSAAVCGEIYVMSLNYPQPPAVKFKKALRGSLATIKPGGDLTPLEAWHQFICRYPQGEPVNFLAASAMDGVICSYVEENLLSALTPIQIETLQRCRGARDAYRDERRNAFRYDCVTGSIPLIPFAGFRGMAVALYLQLDNDWQSYQEGAAARILADLSQVRFPELALPECMKKYEAVSLEEAKRRGAEQREKNKREHAAKNAAAKAHGGDGSR